MNLSQMQYYKEQKGYSLDKLSELSGVPRGTLQKIFTLRFVCSESFSGYSY